MLGGHTGRPVRRIATLAAVALGAGSLALAGASPAAALPTSTIPVGNDPFGVVVTPDGGTAYVTDAGDDTVSVVDTASETVTATIPVGSGPNSIVENTSGTRVYVGNSASGTVSVIDTATNTVVDTFTGVSQAQGLALSADGSSLYIGDSGSHEVTVLDAQTGAFVAGYGTSGFSDARQVLVNADGSDIYVSNTTAGEVIEFNTTTIAVRTFSTGGGAFGMAFSPDGSSLYVADNVTGTLDVVSTASMTLSRRIAVGSTPIGVALSSDGSTAYVANLNSNSISVVDTASGTVTSTISVDSPYLLALSSDGNTLYAPANLNAELTKISLRSAPDAPVSPSATAGVGTATVTFTVPASDGNSAITGYDYSLDGGTTWSALSYSVSGSTVTGTITGLTGGRTYQVSLRARNAVGAGASITPVSVTPLAPASVPVTAVVVPPAASTPAPAPGAVIPADAPGHVLVAPGDHDLAVSFDRTTAVTGAKITGYQVSTDAGKTWRTVSPTGSPLLAVVSGLQNGKSYDVEVRATTTAGPGTASAAVTATLATTWFQDPVSAAQRHAEIAVPAFPAGYVGPARNTTSFGRSHNGTVAIPATSLAHRHLSRGQAVTLTQAGMFVFDSATITKAGIAQLRTVAAALRGNAAVTCEGYADYAADHSHEDQLAAQRARAVCKALVSFGAQVKTAIVSYGPRSPATVGGTAVSRSANRRVVVFVSR